MTRNEMEKMMANAVLNYDSAKESASREVILKGMPQEGKDLETAAANIKIIDPSFTTFEIDEVQRFAKPDPTGVPPLRVSFKRRAMATRINDLIEMAGEEGVPWATASLPFLVRQKNRLVEKDVRDLNSQLPMNPPKHWEIRKCGGHQKKKYVPNPGFNKDAVAPALLPQNGTPGVSAEQARLAMEEISRITKETGAQGASSGAASGATSEAMDQDLENEEEPDIENWTPEYREKIMKLLEDGKSPTPTPQPPKAPVVPQPTMRPTRSQSNLNKKSA